MSAWPLYVYSPLVEFGQPSEAGSFAVRSSRSSPAEDTNPGFGCSAPVHLLGSVKLGSVIELPSASRQTALNVGSTIPRLSFFGKNRVLDT